PANCRQRPDCRPLISMVPGVIAAEDSTWDGSMIRQYWSTDLRSMDSTIDVPLAVALAEGLLHEAVWRVLTGGGPDSGVPAPRVGSVAQAPLLVGAAAAGPEDDLGS